MKAKLLGPSYNPKISLVAETLEEAIVLEYFTDSGKLSDSVLMDVNFQTRNHSIQGQHYDNVILTKEDPDNRTASWGIDAAWDNCSKEGYDAMIQKYHESVMSDVLGIKS
jgi:hypothetical protein